MKEIFIVLSIFVNVSFGLPSEDISGIKNDSKVEIQNIIPAITNGTRAERGQFPYQVAVTIEIGGYPTYCSGTLIRHRWVLTSAHCLLPIYSEIRVGFGTLHAYVAEWRSEIIPRDDFRVHPDFISARYLNNIALIYVRDMPDTIMNSPNIGIVDMPDEHHSKLNLTGRVGTTSGFGRTSDSIIPSDPILYFTTHNIVPNYVCEAAYGNIITNNNICVDTTTGGSPCGSDAGGPMTIVVDAERTILFGVVSATPEFCTIGNPVFYESVIAHRDWIERTMNGSSMIGGSFALVCAVFMMAIKNSF